MIQMRTAQRGDLPQVETLLKREDLPALGPQVPLSNVLVAEEDRAIIGAIALEVFGRTGLVQGVVVVPERRGRGVGRELLRSLLARAHELSLRELYVVPGSGAGFFSALDFEAIGDAELPGSLRLSRAFRSRGEAGGEVMRLALR